jgi:hypothetical protein
MPLSIFQIFHDGFINGEINDLSQVIRQTVTQMYKVLWEFHCLTELSNTHKTLLQSDTLFHYFLNQC